MQKMYPGIMPYPGVMPMSSGSGVKTTHALIYKWVSIILIIQGLLFIFPRLVWRRYESEITSLFKGRPSIIGIVKIDYYVH